MITTQDILKRMDLTAGGDMTASAINQLVDTARPARGKGLIIATTDTALNEPEVPNPNVLLEGITPDYWVNYLWLRIPFNDTGVIKVYAWNPHVVAHATYLNWVQFGNDDLVDEMAEVRTVAEGAETTANTANVNAATAVANVQNLTVDVGLINNRVSAVESMNTQQNTRLDDIDTSIENIATGQGGIVPITRGGSGSETPYGARVAFELQYTPVGHVIIREKQDPGVNGGNFASGDWVVRTLNQRVSIGKAGVVVLNGDNTFDLSAGIFKLKITCPARSVDMHQALLRNMTLPGTPVVAYGTSEHANLTDGTQSSSIIIAFVTVTTAEKFRVEHRCASANVAGDGLGRANNFGGDEIYTQIEIEVMNAV